MSGVDIIQLVGGGAALTALAGLAGRWLGVRSAERRDLLHTALERVAKLEGRCDTLQAQVAAAQQALSDERTSCAQKIAQHEIRIAQLEAERDELAGERDELSRELERRRARSKSPPVPIPAQTNAPDRR